MPSTGITISNVFAAQTGPIPLAQLDTDFSTVASAVNTLLNTSNYFVDSSGAPNVITVTVPAPLVFSYVAGVALQVLLANTNTSTGVNINVNALGNKPVIINDGGNNPNIGALVAGNIINLMYDGTSFRVTSRLNSVVLMKFGDGTVGAPSVSFVSDPDTGIYRDSANELAVSAGGIAQFQVGTTRIALNLPAQLATDSVSAPGLYWIADGNTGLYHIGADNIGITCGGAKVADISAAAFNVTASDLQLNGSSVLVTSTGSFTATLTGYAASPTGTVHWTKNGDLVTLFIVTTSITGTSNSTILTMTGLPAAVRPVGAVVVPCSVINNGQGSPGSVVILAGASTITFAIVAAGIYDTSAFTSSGLKGLSAGWQITYNAN